MQKRVVRQSQKRDCWKAEEHCFKRKDIWPENTTSGAKNILRCLLTDDVEDKAEEMEKASKAEKEKWEKRVGGRKKRVEVNNKRICRRFLLGLCLCGESFEVVSELEVEYVGSTRDVSEFLPFSFVRPDCVSLCR